MDITTISIRHIYAVFLITLFIVLMPGCTERVADNPFDPDSQLPPPLDVRLMPMDGKIELRWSLTQSVSDIEGFRIYRAVDTLSNASRYVDLPPDQFQFVDSLVENGTRYFYQISIRGEVVETARSSAQETVIGPGTHWILSSFGYCVKQVSYDLRYELNYFATNFRPSAWAFFPQDTLIWYSFAGFSHGISEFNRLDGQETALYIDNDIEPVDVARYARENIVYVLDETGPRVLATLGNNVTGEIPLDSVGIWSDVEYDSLENQILVYGENGLHAFAESNLEPRFSVEWSDGLTGQAMHIVGIRGYMLATNFNTEMSYIYTVDLADGAVLDTVAAEGVLYRIHLDWVNDWFYVAQAIPNQPDSYLQLSLDGQRQLERTGFGFIEQIHVNPFDRSVIIVDSGNELLYLYDKLGNFVSESLDPAGKRYFITPIRVFVE